MAKLFIHKCPDDHPNLESEEWDSICRTFIGMTDDGDPQFCGKLTMMYTETSDEYLMKREPRKRDAT